MRSLGIDYGTRRIGLAISDESGKYVNPLVVLEVTSPESARVAVLGVIASEHVEQLVIGLPLNMDGTIGKSARDVIAWAQQLKTKLVFVDERLSSFDAEQQLIERKRGGEKMTRKRKKAQLDALAAAGFLRDYLEGKLPALLVDGT